MIIGSSESGKANALLNLISSQLDIDKICVYAKGSYKPKYPLLINKRESVCLSRFNDSKAFAEYSNDIGGIYENIDEYNPNKNAKY